MPKKPLQQRKGKSSFFSPRRWYWERVSQYWSSMTRELVLLHGMMKQTLTHGGKRSLLFGEFFVRIEQDVFLRSHSSLSLPHFAMRIIFSSRPSSRAQFWGWRERDREGRSSPRFIHSFIQVKVCLRDTSINTTTSGLTQQFTHLKETRNIVLSILIEAENSEHVARYTS